MLGRLGSHDAKTWAIPLGTEEWGRIGERSETDEQVDEDMTTSVP